MAYAKIVITQDGVSGAAGVARKDLDLFAVASKPIVFTNETSGDVGVNSWEWTLLERPPGSAASLSGATTATAQLQADVYGRYVVSLRVNGLGDSTDGYSLTVAGCPYPSLLTLPSGDELGDWVLPAATEGWSANWDGNPYGAQPEVYRIFKQIRELLLSSNFQETKRLRFVFSGSMVQNIDTAAPAYGTAARLPPINFANLPWVDKAKFYAIIKRSAAAGTAGAHLWDASNAVLITNGTVTTTNASYTYLESADVAISNAPGDLRNDGLTTYECLIDIVGGAPGVDFVDIVEAGILLLPA